MRKIARQTAAIRGFSALKPRVSKPDLVPMESEGKDWRRGYRLWALGLAVAVFAALRIAAVYNVAGHWDEFGLFENASITHETGVLSGGPRGSLGTAARPCRHGSFPGLGRFAVCDRRVDRDRWRVQRSVSIWHSTGCACVGDET